MKLKKIMPLFAIALGLVLAVATSGFRSEPYQQFSFKYVPPAMDPDPYSDANVRDTSNWVFTTNPTGCDDEDHRACLLQVSEDYVDQSGLQPKIKSTLNIQTGEDLVNHTHYVNGIDDPTGVYINKTN